LRAFVVNEDATPVEVLLELSDDQKAALDTELACLKAQLPVIRAINDAPSFERRQNCCLLHTRPMMLFAGAGRPVRGMYFAHAQSGIWQCPRSRDCFHW
jgi:hypothetical protein